VRKQKGERRGVSPPVSSTIRNLVLTCDGCKSAKFTVRATKHLDEAEAAGWLCSRKEDLCPKCKPPAPLPAPKKPEPIIGFCSGNHDEWPSYKAGDVGCGYSREMSQHAIECGARCPKCRAWLRRLASPSKQKNPAALPGPGQLTQQSLFD
jgi:hypothetical protein